MTELQTLALIVETEPDPEDIRLIEKRLYEFNVQATGITDGKLFALFLRGTDGIVVSLTSRRARGEMAIDYPAGFRIRGAGHECVLRTSQGQHPLRLSVF
jgi:hypothetical protein